jgi:hypothetical protein
VPNPSSDLLSSGRLCVLISQRPVANSIGRNRGGKLPPHHLAYLLSDTCDESPLASYIGDATGLSEFMTVFVAESAAFAQDLQFRRFRCSIIVGGPR